MSIALLAATTTSIAVIGLVIIILGWVVYGLFNVRRGRYEAGSEVELAPNRKPYYDDETLEGPRLERVQLISLLLLVVVVIGLPLYWVLEPSRQAGAQDGWNNRFASWGSHLFAPTAEGGFNCAGCHGGMNATGGEASYTVTDPQTNEVESVSWKAPALNTIYYRFSDDEVKFILVYGRPFSPMSPWGLEGGGPMNAQQITNVMAYLHSIQIPREDCLEGEDPLSCDSGHLPSDIQADIETLARQSVEDGTYASYGEALFNLDLASGAYSCARCHTIGWSYGQPGVSGQGAFGWNLTGGAVNRHFKNQEQLIDFIKSGSENGRLYGLNGQGSGRMPGFGTMLTDEQITAIVEYIESL